MDGSVSKFVRGGMRVVGGLLFLVVCLSLIVNPSFEVGANAVKKQLLVQAPRQQTVRITGIVQATQIPSQRGVTHSLQSGETTYYLKPATQAVRRRLTRLETKTIVAKGKLEPTTAANTLAILNVTSVTTFIGRVTVPTPTYSVSPSTKPIELHSVTPSSGPINTPIVLTGEGFTRTGNVVNINDVKRVRTNLASLDGKTLRSTVPAYPCSQGTICIQIALSEGTYEISVTNANGETSNTVPYTITAN